MKLIKNIFIISMVLMSLSCTNKQEKLSNETYVSKVKIPELKDKNLHVFAETYDEFINEAIEKSLENDGNVDKAYQAEFQKDFEIYQGKMKIALDKVSPRDASFFSKYISEKNQELAEKASIYDVK